MQQSVMNTIATGPKHTLWQWLGVSSSKMQPILDELNRDLIGYKLNTRLRQAHFMAQVRQEVGASFSLREQVEYMGATALKQIGYYKTHPKQAEIDGYKKEKDPQMAK
ncbi:hypothetical protein L2096_10890 [Acinetobacter sp. ACZLY 512]|uniref:hypothetical protein n=1 Tax=Acinetobacter sp. ACZLY 512 TaxID=2911206 RepID=UPI0020263185|nr:hypothetical protein [Acinetobacter sp. ACZLY 512]MCL9676724.1 hypothetical protein [Acinetobacter sp. ACZLY 512]